MNLAQKLSHIFTLFYCSMHNPKLSIIKIKKIIDAIQKQIGPLFSCVQPSQIAFLMAESCGTHHLNKQGMCDRFPTSHTRYFCMEITLTALTTCGVNNCIILHIKSTYAVQEHSTAQVFFRRVFSLPPPLFLHNGCFPPFSPIFSMFSLFVLFFLNG